MEHYKDEEEWHENTAPPADPATPEEQAEHEKETSHPEYIYNIKGRITNHISARGAHLTPMGEMLCNMQAHMLKEFYIFASVLDPQWAEKLRELIRKHEEMPANLIMLGKR